MFLLIASSLPEVVNVNIKYNMRIIKNNNNGLKHLSITELPLYTVIFFHILILYNYK